MKLQVIMGTFVMLSSIGALASSWTEKLTCEFTRYGEDETVVKSIETTKFIVAGPHNGESGTVKINSNLIPSYSVVYNLKASGRYDLDTLTTILNSNDKIVAKSSVFDYGKNIKIKNQFVTENGDYLITIECNNSTVIHK